ncbi:cell division control protein 48 homolog C-like [Olea europaea var. sylvestris]|uniref:Cell division control 48 homolog C n=1 Tax=Olea europaea subsp. europaea TaxID=158383 RepID=A0A8S0RLN0_OLEEU|nr:cell division control protein 48 homolog C-like [Olea europaea var. sylvestris]CAA2980161.1 cell division control 48 homolog C [Olea europaea subsp. europaea]
MTPKQKRKVNFVRKRPRPPGGQGFDRLLRRRIELSKNQCTSVDQLVVYLRSTYPEYSRHKLQPFTKGVQQILDQMDDHNNEEYDDEKTSPGRKRPKKVEKAEEKLQLIEAQHIRKRTARINDDFENDAGSASSMASAASNGTSESESDNSSEEDISTEDAIYEEKLEPKFDLMKSMLRDNYNEKSKKMGKEGEKRNVVEMEVVNNVDKEVNLMNERRIYGNDSELLKIKGGNGLTVINNKNKDIRNNNSNGPLFKDLGGMSEVLEELKMEVIVPFFHPYLPRNLGVRPVSGILLHGPPGCGKTKLANAIANETGVPFYKICATELVSGVSGTSEENIRELFSKAHRTAPSIVFIDEIDAIATKREISNRVMEQRIVTQLMSCMDESSRIFKPVNGSGTAENFDCMPGYVLVIGATNRPDSIDPALRRSGRFDREIYIGVPDESARVDILSVLTQNLKVEGAFDLLKIAKSTAGFVGADLVALTDKAGNLAMNRIIGQRKVEVSTELIEGETVEEWWRQPWSPEEMEKLSITMADFEKAVKMVQSSSTREGFSAIPSVKWEDVGGLQLLRDVFDRDIVRRIKYPEDYEEFGVDLETGFLLYGPPGCGKTLIAKAVANEAGANFIHIKGPELLNKYVGESELAVRTIFGRARTCSPCILFFDEVDALTTRRGQEGGWVVERLLNQLLIELDGADQRKGVYVIGATNRPEVMDRALLRPGRFGKLLYVPLPSPNECGLILTALGRKKRIDANLDLMAIGSDSACKNFSGADLSALMNEAAMTALQDKQNSQNKISNVAPWTIKEIHFKKALEKISPSVSDAQIRYYELLSESFKAA